MQPVISGPLSELSSSIRVRGQLPGASVTVQSGSRTVAEGVATSADQRFPLLNGVTLSRADVLYAVQSIGPDSSDVPSGNQGMPVAPGPTGQSDLKTVRLVTHPYECGQYVWVDGAIPGATVELLVDSTPIGIGTADEGVARFETIGIYPGGWVTLFQSAPGLAPGPDVGQRADDIPVRSGEPLPPPVLVPPIRGCDASIQVNGVIDGALVTIERSSGTVDTAGFDRDSLRFILSKPLDEDDQLIVRQEVGRICERAHTDSDPYTVGKAAPVDAPQIVTPLCAGATIVRVTGLRPGAIVHLAANKQTYDGAVPPDQTWLDCRVPGLTTDPVSATQELCDVTSAPAKPVAVDPHQDNVPAAQVYGPLYSCTASVCVTAAHPGALLQVFARTPRGDIAISDQALSINTNAVISVAPLLNEGDQIFVRQWACSDTSVDSGTELVQPHPDLEPVYIVGAPLAGDLSVAVRGAVYGATVMVYSIDGRGYRHYLGSGRTDTLHPVVVVPLNRPLEAEEGIRANQTLCGDTSISDVPEPVTVGDAPAPGPRPFYVVGHNPNTFHEAIDDLNNGANALEPDVQVYADHADQLCISHGLGDSDAHTLTAYLDKIHELAQDNSQLSLVVFDCKPPYVVTPDHGFELLMAIRQHLTFDNDVNVILSIPHFVYVTPGGITWNTGLFDRIVDILGPREGLMIDAEDDPGSVSNYFTSRGVNNQGYGNGISFSNVIIGPYYRYSLEAACGDRAQAGRPNFIYVWTVNDPDELREYIRIGVDGAITDDVADLRTIASEGQFASTIRLATRADDPFKPANFAYGLHIHTADKWMAGTDANITFTLTGEAGSVSKTVNTKLIKRMESGEWNWVTIPSQNLGELHSITVQRDNAGNGPDWFLDHIDVGSARFSTTATGNFNRWIDSTDPYTEPLV
jgi:PLAT/LH2 domain